MINLPKDYNYIGVFLTLRCNYNCSYCITNFNGNRRKFDELEAKHWINFFNKLNCNDIPVTLQGGEPFLYPDLITIINETKQDIKFDILTSLGSDEVNIDNFIKNVKPERLVRNSPYAPIRVSYHPEKVKLDELLKKVLILMENGFRVGVYGILHPLYKDEVMKAQIYCLNSGIDFRVKPFLGYYNNKLYGEYKYKEGLMGKNKSVMCKTTELLIAPDGSIFRCHSDLYNYEGGIGTILDENFVINDGFKVCNKFGSCNPCDLKIKTNRFQQFGHTAVEIKELT